MGCHRFWLLYYLIDSGILIHNSIQHPFFLQFVSILKKHFPVAVLTAQVVMDTYFLYSEKIFCIRSGSASVLVLNWFWNSHSHFWTRNRFFLDRHSCFKKPFVVWARHNAAGFLLDKLVLYQNLLLYKCVPVIGLG